MYKPLVSICIPTYNGALYLRACIDSCIGQTYTNYEIIICDDVSTDDTSVIIEEYLQKSDKIRFIKNPHNLGLVGNWNKCMQEAKGEWVKFIFQDDYMEPNCLQKFVGAIEKDVYLIVCKRNFIIEKKATEDVLDYYQQRVKTLENTGYFISNNFSARIISKIASNNVSLNFIAEPSLSFINKEIISKMGYFDSDLKQICDLEYLLRISSVYGLKYIPEKLCGFRIHDKSTTEKNVNTSKNYYNEHIEALLFGIKLLHKKEFFELRNFAGFNGQLKLKWFVKYRSYKAFKAIANSTDKEIYSNLKKQYGNYFYSAFDIPLLKLTLLIR